MADDKNDSYTVGYKKPPVDSRFKKGQSGNPKGRPERTKNLSTLIADAVNQKITIREGERRRRISKREAMIIQLANKAALGDHRSIKLLFALLEKHELTGNGGAPPKAEFRGPPPLTEEEQAARTLEILKIMHELGLSPTGFNEQGLCLGRVGEREWRVGAPSDGSTEQLESEGSPPKPDDSNRR